MVWEKVSKACLILESYVKTLRAATRNSVQVNRMRQRHELTTRGTVPSTHTYTHTQVLTTSMTHGTHIRRKALLESASHIE